MGQGDDGVEVPILLRSDNFTPAERTPWGGRKIVTRYKAAHGVLRADCVGESWELSVSEEHPSRTADGRDLRRVLASCLGPMLGRESLSRDSTALAVRWLDAAEPLAVQVAPPRDYRPLRLGESGTTAFWYVVDHEPEAGVHFGFLPGVNESSVRHAIDRRSNLSDLMPFQPVAVGDCFVVEPGLPHAIGAGVTMIQASFVQPSCVGVTYRFWDWHRRYDESGRLDSAGEFRFLNVDDAVAVTDWSRADDADWLAARRCSLGRPEQGPARLQALCGPGDDAALATDVLRASRIFGSGSIRLPNWSTLTAITVVAGSVRFADGTRVATGYTAALPAAMGATPVELDCAHAILTAVVR